MSTLSRREVILSSMEEFASMRNNQPTAGDLADRCGGEVQAIRLAARRALQLGPIFHQSFRGRSDSSICATKSVELLQDGDGDRRCYGSSTHDMLPDAQLALVNQYTCQMCIVSIMTALFKELSLVSVP